MKRSAHGYCVDPEGCGYQGNPNFGLVVLGMLTNVWMRVDSGTVDTAC